jgi:integrase
VQLKITERALLALQKQATKTKTDRFMWDTEQRCFGVKATRRGSVSFIVQKRFKGKPKRIVVGEHPWMQVDTARKNAMIYIGEMWRASNPLFLTPGLSTHAPVNLSQDQLEPTFDRWFKKHQQPGTHWKEIKRSYTKDVIPTLGAATLIAAITKTDVRKLIEAKQDAGKAAMARTLFAVMMPFFKWCVAQEIITTSPMETLARPKAGRSRNRYLSPDEIVKLWQAATTLGYPYGQFYKFALLTGQRNETEIGLMKWSEIKNGLWTIPSERVKNKQEHFIHLSPQAMAVLKSIPLTLEYVFIAKRTGRAINGFAEAKRNVDELLKFSKPWVVHDLRRTMVTHMSAMKIDPNVSDRILNHVSKARSGIAGVYQQFEFMDERKEAIEKYGAWIGELISRSE